MDTTRHGLEILGRDPCLSKQIRYVSLKLMLQVKTPFQNAFAAHLCRKPEGFFQRALGSYSHKFPKRGAASLTYLPCLRLGLPHLCLGLPHLCLSRNLGPATEGFPNHNINFTYRIAATHVQSYQVFTFLHTESN